MSDFEKLGRLIAGYWFGSDDDDSFSTGDFIDQVGMWLEALDITYDRTFQEGTE